MSTTRPAASLNAWRRFAPLLGLLCAFVGVPTAHAGEKTPNLPIELHRAAKPDGTLMLLLSGDGGPGALDKRVTERANAAGIDVIGLDSYAYFYDGRTPDRLAADLQHLIDRYGEAWHARRLVLAGYSFGADALPFAWKHLPHQTRRRTALIALIGLQPAANFEISIWEMLDLPAPDDTPMEKALPDLPLHRVICIHGVGDYQGCSLPALAGASRVAIPGDHQLGGNYDAVADAMLARLSGS